MFTTIWLEEKLLKSNNFIMSLFHNNIKYIYFLINFIVI